MLQTCVIKKKERQITRRQVINKEETSVIMEKERSEGRKEGRKLGNKEGREKQGKDENS